MGGPRLVVWRHGETAHNASGMWQGQLDTPLSPVGVAQARAAAPALAALAPSVVVSSDLARAAATADELGAVLGLQVRRDARLREIHVGGWQGKTTAQVREEYPEDAERLLTGEDFRRGGTGETVAEVERRVLAAAHEVVAGLDDGTAVLVTHGVTGRALVAGLLGLDQQLAWQTLTGLRNCHWAQLSRMPSGAWRLDAWNAGVLPGATSDGAA